MKKLFAALMALLLILTGCQKQQRQADIRLPEPETPAAEETIAEPAEEPEQESVAPDLGNFKGLLEVLQTLQTLDDWKIPRGAIMICPVWRLRCSGVCLGRKIWSWKPRRRLNGSGPGLSGHSDTFMKRTQQDCRRSIRLPLPQSIRLWIITGHGKMR